MLNNIEPQRIYVFLSSAEVVRCFLHRVITPSKATKETEHFSAHATSSQLASRQSCICTTGHVLLTDFFVWKDDFCCGIGMISIETVCALRFPMNWLKKNTFIDYGHKSGFFRSKKNNHQKIVLNSFSPRANTQA